MHDSNASLYDDTEQTTNTQTIQDSGIFSSEPVVAFGGSSFCKTLIEACVEQEGFQFWIIFLNMTLHHGSL
jgi:hypothetical protein